MSFRHSVKKIFPATRLLKRHWTSFGLLIVLTFIAVGLETFSIGLVIPILGAVLNTDSIQTGSHGWIIDRLELLVAQLPGENLFVTMCWVLLGMTLLKFLFVFSRDSLKAHYTHRIRIDCQEEMFAKHIDSDMKFFIHHKSGDLVYRVMSLSVDVSAYFTLLPSIFIDCINIALMSILLLSISKVSFFIVLGFSVVFGFSIWLLSQKVFTKAGREANEVGTEQNIIVGESISGIREILSYEKRKEWKERFKKQCQKYYDLKVKVVVLRLIPGSLLELVVVGGGCITGIYFGLKAPQMMAKIFPIVAVYAIAAVRMVPSFSTIGQNRTQLASYAPAVELFERYKNETTVYIKRNGRQFQAFQDVIRFAGVNFSYLPNKPVLRNLNLDIPKGKTVAIVGGSGAGKSTIVDLLLRFYNFDLGEITVDGIDLKDFSPESWRQQIGVVAQNSTIFHASVSQNIALQFKNIDMDRVIVAAKASGAHEFVTNLQSGYDSELGDRGFKLSGGQRQRIAIARALYRNPEIFIFDEATSALDNRTEKMITETMINFVKNKTVIILAHRFSTIERADIIYVLKDGAVAQAGTHQELLQKKGEYSNLYQKESVH